MKKGMIPSKTLRTTRGKVETGSTTSGTGTDAPTTETRTAGIAA